MNDQFPTILMSLSCSNTAEESPPQDGLPHVTTLPPALIAAKADLVEKMERMSLSCSRTVEEFPPEIPWPHVTTLPSVLMAAKANLVEEMELISVS